MYSPILPLRGIPCTPLHVLFTFTVRSSTVSVWLIFFMATPIVWNEISVKCTHGTWSAWMITFLLSNSRRGVCIIFFIFARYTPWTTFSAAQVQSWHCPFFFFVAVVVVAIAAFSLYVWNIFICFQALAVTAATCFFISSFLVWLISSNVAVRFRFEPFKFSIT